MWRLTSSSLASAVSEICAICGFLLSSVFGLKNPDANLLREPRGISLRGEILPHHKRAVRSAPVVALFAEWHKQSVPKAVVLTQGIAWNADHDLAMRDVDAQRREPGPSWKHGAEVRVVLPPDLRMVDAVHARGDEHFI